jgi:RNA polymerase sigma-70 factor (ECF subfamily)
VPLDAFLAQLSATQRAGAETQPDLAIALAELWEAAIVGWDPPPVTPDELAAWVGARIPADATDLVAAVRGLRGPDLYLACACARGEPRATAMLEHKYMPGIRAALRAMRAGHTQVDEALQQVRERLLVGDAERGPRIADYTGRGDLRRWLRASAVHTYLNIRRGEKREVLVDDDRVFDAVATPDVDPELAHMKELYRVEFKQAFSEAVLELSDQEKNLLRYRHVERLGIEEVAEIYRVHRATMHRWLAAARDTLARATEQALLRRLGVAGSELQSIRRLVESQIDLSLVRVLGPDGT